MRFERGSFKKTVDVWKKYGIIYFSAKIPDQLY